MAPMKSQSSAMGGGYPVDRLIQADGLVRVASEEDRVLILVTSTRAPDDSRALVAGLRQV